MEPLITFMDRSRFDGPETLEERPLGVVMAIAGLRERVMSVSGGKVWREKGLDAFGAAPLKMRRLWSWAVAAARAGLEGIERDRQSMQTWQEGAAITLRTDGHGLSPPHLRLHQLIISRGRRHRC